ncbi:MAG: hypothetical protein ABJF10_06580 [Chthoniobacter sp.]|uniref:hypothetical protein n=1 Tax=Chthoniobacter sp. TaxID=2510640 RepID=UPI0032AC9F76
MRNKQNLPPPIDTRGKVAYTPRAVVRELFYPVREIDSRTLLGTLPDFLNPEGRFENFCLIYRDPCQLYIHTAELPDAEFNEWERIGWVQIEQTAEKWNQELNRDNEQELR